MSDVSVLVFASGFCTENMQAATLKDQGNKAFAAKRYDEAIELFTKAIALDPSNHVLYSNRSAAKAGKKLWADALADAEEVGVGGIPATQYLTLANCIDHSRKSKLGERIR